MASLTKSCIEKKKRATALIDGGTKTKTPTLGRVCDKLDKRCKVSDFTNYITINARNSQERVVSNEYSKSKRQLKFLKRMLSVAFPLMTLLKESVRIRLCGCFIDKNQQKKT